MDRTARLSLSRWNQHEERTMTYATAIKLARKRIKIQDGRIAYADPDFGWRVSSIIATRASLAQARKDWAGERTG